MNRFFAKVGNGFKKFGAKVGDTCDNAADSVRAKGLEIRIDEQYENLGRLTYRAQHTGEDLEQEVMEVIAKIDALFDELESIKAAKEARKEKPEEPVCECECTEECTEEAAESETAEDAEDPEEATDKE
jgi:hypothetical protein